MDFLKRTWAEIRLDALAHNFRQIRRKVGPDCKIMAVVKADGYGHGDRQVSQVFQREGADWFAVSNIEEAMQPMYTTKPEQDRSGMGFAFMEAFMDSVEVESEPGKGTKVRMKKTIGKGREIWTTQSL